MPASLVDDKFKMGKLRSGSKTGPVVTSPKQAKAIQLSEARKEGYSIPVPKIGRGKGARKIRRKTV